MRSTFKNYFWGGA